MSGSNTKSHLHKKWESLAPGKIYYSSTYKCYFDCNGRYYYDYQGKKVYLAEEDSHKEKYYADEEGKKYFYDHKGEKHYPKKHKKGERKCVETSSDEEEWDDKHDKHAWVQLSSDDKSVDEHVSYWAGEESSKSFKPYHVKESFKEKWVNEWAQDSSDDKHDHHDKKSCQETQDYWSVPTEAHEEKHHKKCHDKHDLHDHHDKETCHKKEKKHCEEAIVCGVVEVTSLEDGCDSHVVQNPCKNSKHFFDESYYQPWNSSNQKASSKRLGCHHKFW